MERSKVWLLTRDMVSIEVGGMVTSELLGQMTPMAFSFIGSGRLGDRYTSTSANPHTLHS